MTAAEKPARPSTFQGNNRGSELLVDVGDHLLDRHALEVGGGRGGDELRPVLSNLSANVPAKTPAPRAGFKRHHIVSPPMKNARVKNDDGSGVNVARAGRIETLAIPADEVQALVARLLKDAEKAKAKAKK